MNISTPGRTFSIAHFFVKGTSENLTEREINILPLERTETALQCDLVRIVKHKQNYLLSTDIYFALSFYTFLVKEMLDINTM